MKTELDRRTLLTAIMALPFVRWAKPKPKLPTGIIAGKPYYVVTDTWGGCGTVSHRDDGSFVAINGLKIGQPVYFE